MAMDSIILVSNPGSTSRKYALYKSKKCLLDLHFEMVGRRVVYSTAQKSNQPTHISHISFAAGILLDIIKQELPDLDVAAINRVGLRIVAPSSFFQRDHIISKNVIKRLERLQNVAPIHIHATLSEYVLLKRMLPKVVFVGVSDSAFLSHKPEHAYLYGISYRDAEKFDIKRFGYHGLSLESVVATLKKQRSLPTRMIVCHMGGGVSVAAVQNGRVLDSTMGYSPIEGVIMATRSGSLDVIAFERLRYKKRMQSDRLFNYFNAQGGLLGVSGISSDVRVLLEREHKKLSAKRALDLYVYKIQQAIGSMSAVMSGVDAIVFAGTVGERSDEIRRRVISPFLYLGFQLDMPANKTGLGNGKAALISKSSHPAKVFVVKVNEDYQIAQHAQSL